jgi:hypothetical protein
VRVIATQIGNTGVVDGLLNFYNGKSFGDVIAVAPYFNPNMNPAGANVTVILDSLAANTGRVDKAISGDLAYANQTGMKLVAYESGLDVWPSSFGITDSLSIRADKIEKKKNPGQKACGNTSPTSCSSLYNG